MILHDGVHGLQGLFRGTGHDDALAGGEAVSLDDQGSAAVGDEGMSRLGVVEHGAFGSGHAGLLHEILGEIFAAFELGAVAVRTEAGDAGHVHGVGDAEHEGKFGTGDNQVDLFLSGELQKAQNVVGLHVGAAHAVKLRAAVAGGDDEIGTERALADFPYQGVLPAAGTDYENAHGFPPWKKAEGLPRRGEACRTSWG